MAYVAHQSAMAVVDKDGSTARDAYIAKADRLRRRHGVNSREHAEALAAIEGPPGPGALAYLLEWFNELFGRSGLNEQGFAPLTFTTVDAWARLTRRKPKPHEVDALMSLDAVKRHPDTFLDDEDADG